MGLMFFFAFLLVGAAVIIKHWDKIRYHLDLRTSLPGTVSLTSSRKRRTPDTGPISVDEFYTFRWRVHQCKDLVYQTEFEGGPPCDYCGSSGVGSF
jgi:hypothetical protein